MYKAFKVFIWSKQVKNSFFKLMIWFPERSSSSKLSKSLNQSTEMLTNRFLDMSKVFSVLRLPAKISLSSESPRVIDEMDNVRRILNGWSILWTLLSALIKSLFSSAFNDMMDVLRGAKTASSNSLNLFLEMSSVLIVALQKAQGCNVTISFLEMARISSRRLLKVPSKIVVILFPSRRRILSLGSDLNSSLDK